MIFPILGEKQQEQLLYQEIKETCLKCELKSFLFGATKPDQWGKIEKGALCTSWWLPSRSPLLSCRCQRPSLFCRLKYGDGGRQQPPLDRSSKSALDAKVLPLVTISFLTMKQISGLNTSMIMFVLYTLSAHLMSKMGLENFSLGAEIELP